MRIGLLAPPFIPVPPVAYGGTELFIAELAEGLGRRGIDVTVYANGESRLSAARVKWLYERADWPLADPAAAHLKNAEHSSWAVCDALRDADLLHVNDVAALPFTRFVDLPIVLTLHHPHEPSLSEVYARYPHVDYVAISACQAQREPMRKKHVVHHGLRLDRYAWRPRDRKEDFAVFLGRMAPCKGAHLAVQAARRAGIRLKLAGEIQPVFREYWEREVRPLVDGVRVEYVGEADWARKNDLLSRARALLFPIQWDEPFGLVMIEAMACGTPVLALPGGAVAEVVRDGVSGWICHSVDELAGRLREPLVPPDSCRDWVAARFSCERMVERYSEIYAGALADVPDALVDASG